jgi:hypothetical protein
LVHASGKRAQGTEEGFMHIRLLTAASVMAAMGLLAGCGADDPGEPNATDDTAYRENTADQAPVPDSASPGTQQPTTGQEMAGRDQPMSDRTGEPGQGQSGGQFGEQQGAQEEGVGMTEFAALDTNSDGKLAEEEWQPDAVAGMEFEQIDEDASGDIDQDEFRQAVTMGGAEPESTGTSEQDDLDPTTP